VVRDPAVHEDVIQRVKQGVEAWGFTCRGHITSPIQGAAKGNTEFLACFDAGVHGAVAPTAAADDESEDEGESAGTGWNTAT